jgi:hypothetical protein
MTTTVYTLEATKQNLSSSLVAHLRSTTPEEAIAKLQKAGVLAIAGPDPSSIVLVGYRLEIRHLLDDWRQYGFARQQDSRFTIGKLAKLRSA